MLSSASLVRNCAAIRGLEPFGGVPPPESRLDHVPGGLSQARPQGRVCSPAVAPHPRSRPDAVRERPARSARDRRPCRFPGRRRNHRRPRRQRLQDDVGEPVDVAAVVPDRGNDHDVCRAEVGADIVLRQIAEEVNAARRRRRRAPVRATRRAGPRPRRSPGSRRAWSRRGPERRSGARTPSCARVARR